MNITENDVDKIEQELLKISSSVTNLYDPAHLVILKNLSLKC